VPARRRASLWFVIDLRYVREELQHRESEDLVDILLARNEDEWRPEVFPIVEELLRERGVRVEEALAARKRTAIPVEPAEAEAPAANLEVLERFDSEVEAKLCQMSLAPTGIEAELHVDEFGVSELLVKASELAAARAVLAAAEDAAGDEGFECRSCGFAAEPLREESRLVCQVCGAES